MVVKFLTPLYLEPISDGENWRVIKPFKVQVNDKTFVVPKGFVTNLASSPRLAWIICPPATGKYRRATVLHDYLYSIRYKRSEADRIFLEAMKKCGVSWWKRRLIYWAVRVGGWTRYLKKGEYK